MSNVVQLPPRKKSEPLTPEQLRNLLKVNLGLNSKMATVKSGSSMSYLTITVRDACVDIDRVVEFAASLSTWEMDVTDYCSGQSITVEVAGNVQDVLAERVYNRVVNCDIPKDGQGLEVAPGIILWRNGFEVWMERKEDRKRSTEFRVGDLVNRNPDVMRRMAYHLARLFKE